DLGMASQPLHRVSDARSARRAARMQRYNDKRDLQRDCVLADWEIAVERDVDRFDDLVLASSTFVRIYRVKANGECVRVPGPSLGRRGKGHAPSARMLIPGRREPSQTATQALAAADLLVVDLQRLRGRRALSTIEAVVTARSPARPTLVVAAN